jgi:hypothetical protein
MRSFSGACIHRGVNVMKTLRRSTPNRRDGMRRPVSGGMRYAPKVVAHLEVQATPAESRTSTSTGAWRSTGECEWKQGDRDGRRYRRGGDKIHPHTQDIRRPRLPFPPARFCASRPPVQAPLRLAALGLNGARPRCRKSSPRRGNDRPWLAGSSCFPLVGTERRKFTETIEQNT